MKHKNGNILEWCAVLFITGLPIILAVASFYFKKDYSASSILAAISQFYGIGGTLWIAGGVIYTSKEFKFKFESDKFLDEFSKQKPEEQTAYLNHMMLNLMYSIRDMDEHLQNTLKQASRRCSQGAFFLITSTICYFISIADFIKAIG